MLTYWCNLKILDTLNYIVIQNFKETKIYYKKPKTTKTTQKCRVIFVSSAPICGTVRSAVTFSETLPSNTELLFCCLM